MLKLPKIWETYLEKNIDFNEFYSEFNKFLNEFKSTSIIPSQNNIFRLFQSIKPDKVKCVLFGEDPYPRIQSANGIAFWDNEIKSWTDKTNGNSLKNILKALLTYKGSATYSTSIEKCRTIVKENNYPQPEQLFQLWLDEGIFLLNTSLTFTNKEDKIRHFKFWEPFLKILIERLSSTNSPYFILWGNKAKKWEPFISDKEKIIKQGHPTFIHQFMNKNDVNYSPFEEIIQKTKLKWI